jgi:hypothetical protein
MESTTSSRIPEKVPNRLNLGKTQPMPVPRTKKFRKLLREICRTTKIGGEICLSVEREEQPPTEEIKIRIGRTGRTRTYFDQVTGAPLHLPKTLWYLMQNFTIITITLVKPASTPVGEQMTAEWTIRVIRIDMEYDFEWLLDPDLH